MGLVRIKATIAAGIAVFAMVASSASAAEPEVTYQFPAEGATLATEPLAFQLCFANPIDVRDLDKGGAFEFRVTPPSGFPLGHRAIFQPDGLGVVVQPGLSGDPIGAWTFDWRVRDRETEEQAQGTIRFTVADGGEPVIPAEPLPCQSDGLPGASPAPTESPGADDPVVEDDSGGTDVLQLALLAVGAAAAVGAVGIVLYMVGRRMRR
jgi:hypothetical protein